MGTLVQAFLLHAKAFFTVLFYVAAVATCISRFYIFYEIYIHETVKIKEDAWLRLKCKEPEFYSNIRQHTDLCSQVEQHGRSWIFLTALNAMVSRNQWCGAKKSCAEYMHSLLVQGFAWPMVACFALFLIALPHIIAARAKQALAERYMNHVNAQTFQHIQAVPFYPQMPQLHGRMENLGRIENPEYIRICDMQHNNNQDDSQNQQDSTLYLSATYFKERGLVGGGSNKKKVHNWTEKHTTAGSSIGNWCNYLTQRKKGAAGTYPRKDCWIQEEEGGDEEDEERDAERNKNSQGNCEYYH